MHINPLRREKRWWSWQALAAPFVLAGSVGCALSSDPVHTFTIIHLNDVYEIFPLPARVADTYEPRGGLAHVGTLLREARQRGPVLVLHAGDFLSPSLLSIKFKHKGAQMIEAMNALEIDMATFGNHEFDFGCHTLAERIHQSTFPWIAANVAWPPDVTFPDGKVLPYRVVTTAGLRVGIFGLTVPLASVPCERGEIAFHEPISTAAAVVAELKREPVDLIIALTHLSIASDRALASAVPDIDVIVGGHDHEMMTDVIGKTLIAKADANATGLGVIRLKATRTRGEWIVEKSRARQEVNPRAVQPDAVVSKAVARYAAELTSLSKTIGATEVPLDVREHVVRDGESNFGSYIADLIRAETGTDVAIVNGGALRGDRIVPTGPLMLEDLENTLVFQDQMVALSVTGDQLLQALENGVSRAGQRDGRFPQVSGLSFVFDPDSPPGRRILRIQIGNTPLDRDRVYSLATIAFLTRPGNLDGYALPTETLHMRGDLGEMVLRNLAKGPIKVPTAGRIFSLGQPR